MKRGDYTSHLLHKAAQCPVNRSEQAILRVHKHNQCEIPPQRTFLSVTFPTSSLVCSGSAASTFFPTPNCSDTDSFKNHKSSVVSETIAVPIS